MKTLLNGAASISATSNPLTKYELVMLLLNVIIAANAVRMMLGV